MSSATSYNTKQKLSGVMMGVSVVMAAALLSVSLPGVVNAADDSTSQKVDSHFNVRVNAIGITIEKINGEDYKGPGSVTDTLKTDNTVTFKADQDADIVIQFGDQVLWKGSVKAGEEITAHFKLPGGVGVYGVSIRAYEPGSTDGYSSTYFTVNYKPAIPSIVPENNDRNTGLNAPNTGLYVDFGGYAVSMTTVISIALLIGFGVVLGVSRRKASTESATAGTKETTVSKTSTKSAKASKAKTAKK